MRWTIRGKLVTVFFCIIVTSVVFVGLRAYHVSRKALEQRIGEGLRKQAFGMVNQLDRILFERYRNIQTWSGYELMADVLTQDAKHRIGNFLTSVKKEYGLYSDLIYTDALGNVIASSNPQFVKQKVLDEAWFQQVLIHQGIHVESGTPKILGSHTVIFAAPSWGTMGSSSVVLEQEKPRIIGVLVAFLDWSEVLDLVNTTAIVPGREQDRQAYAMLINRDGLALTQPYFDQRAVFLREKLTESLEAARLAVQKKEGYLIEPGRHGEENLIGFAASRGYRDFKGFGWSVLVFESTDESLAPIKRLEIQIFGFGILVAAFVCGFSLFLAGGVTKPLEKLASHTRDIARGDFSRRIDVVSKDEIGSLAGSFNEMTEALEKTSHDLIEAKDYTDNILKSSMDTLLVVDGEGKIKTCNPALLNLLGYQESELLGRPLELLISDEDLKNGPLMKSLRKGELSQAEIHYKTKAQALVPALISAASMNGREGGPRGVVVSGQNIEEYKKLEQQFRQAQKMDAVGRLAGGIAHDFNNVLTAINCFGQKILMCSSPDKAVTEDVNEMLKASSRAARLVRQLLAFSRLQIIKPSIINMNDLILNMAKMIQLLIGAGTELEVLPGPSLWTVKVDAGQMEQVLANLASNARDAMPKEKGKLVIETANITITPEMAAQNPGMKTGDFVSVSVKDNGKGMSEDTKKHLFEPFFTTKDKSTGTGLGLATCYGIMKQSGGYIQVESEEGKGAIFRIYLPRVDGTPEAFIEEKKFSADLLPRGNETILLVEDEVILRNVGVEILQRQGYQVVKAANGLDALQKAKAMKGKPLHMVLTDMVMPEMGGRELAEEILKIFPRIRILFVSGYTEDPMIHSQAFSSRVDFLQKPFSISDLAMRVRQLLDR